MDMTPTIREMDDGTLGYFYTPQQLDFYRLEREIWKLQNCAKWDEIKRGKKRSEQLVSLYPTQRGELWQSP